MSTAQKKDPLTLDERKLLYKRVSSGMCTFAPAEGEIVGDFLTRGLIERVIGEEVHISTGRSLRFDQTPYPIVLAYPVFKVTKAGQDALDWKP